MSRSILQILGLTKTLVHQMDHLELLHARQLQEVQFRIHALQKRVLGKQQLQELREFKEYEQELRQAHENQLKDLKSASLSASLSASSGSLLVTWKLLKSVRVFEWFLMTNSNPRQAAYDPKVDLTGGLVEFLLRVVMKHDDLDDHLNSLEVAYRIDALRFGSRHPWWGIIAARFHLCWWSLIIFTKGGIAMSPAGKLVRSVAKKWGF